VVALKTSEFSSALLNARTLTQVLLDLLLTYAPVVALVTH